MRSIQAANVDMPEDELLALWQPVNLERLARTYWKYLSRVTLGIIRVTYTEQERAVVVIGRPLVLLRFHAPEYDISDGRGIVQWKIQDGLLVSKRNEGYLEIDVKRMESDREGYARMHVEVEVANFYPALVDLHRALGLRQHAVAHPRAGHARVPALAGQARSSRSPRSGASPSDGPRGPVNVGDTPWQGVAVLTLLAAALASSLRLRRARRKKKGWRRRS